MSEEDGVDNTKFGNSTGEGKAFNGLPAVKAGRLRVEDLYATIGPDGEVSGVIQAQRINVDKRTHRLRFEDEDESSVTVVIEPK